MKIFKGLCAIALTCTTAASAADLLPALTSAESGGATVNSPVSQGFAERGRLMIADANYRGAADQLRQALLLNPAPGAQREAAEYYLAIACAHIPGEDAAGMFTAFLEKYPASPYRERAMLGLAGALMDNADYTAALEIYNSINPDALSSADADARNYYRAYCLLQFGRYGEARDVYEHLLGTSLSNQAMFYLGYTDYVQGNYRSALNRFEQVRVDGTDPAGRTPYYLAQLYYSQGDYRKALKEANALLAEGCPKEYLAETQRIAGESYYATGDKARALPLLRVYEENVEQPRPSAMYILGLTDYDEGRYRDAIRRLSAAVGEDNAMGQTACLVMGQSYMQLADYDAAMMAFDRAVKKNFEAETTQLASYNYAVAASKGGKMPFGSSVSLFESFLRNYPASPMAPQVADYIINGYITDNNYAAALRAINNIKTPSDRVLAAKQQVLYMHGARQLRSGHTDDAVKALTEARSLGRFSGETASAATLWLGEALYKKSDYKGAEKQYAAFLRETPSKDKNHALALYDMAYAKFALKDFSGAADYFGRYLKALTPSTAADVAALKTDALNRLGDSFYYRSDFATAATHYEQAITQDPSSADYPMFQKAIMKGLQRDHAAKISGLAQMMERFPNSALIPSALLETGESYTELSDNPSAIKAYTQLAERFPSTAQGRQGALLLAIAELNSGQTDRAITAYKNVITKYPTSDEARAAAEDLKHIYADRGDIAGYTSFLATVPDAPKMDRSELVALQLEGVEKAAESGRDADALRMGRELVEAYPDASEAVEALAIIAPIEERNGRPEQALQAYRDLAAKASGEIRINQARMGILRVSRDLGNDADVMTVAAQLLQSSSLGANDRKEVMLARANALLNTGKRDEARSLLTDLADDPQSLPGAKAAYYLAQNYFDAGDTAKAEETVNKLIDSNTPHDYWLARGFILMSDIKRRNGDTFGADEYLRSLRENYPGNEPDIFQLIDSRK